MGGKQQHAWPIRCDRVASPKALSLASRRVPPSSEVSRAIPPTRQAVDKSMQRPWPASTNQLNGFR